MSDEEEIVEEEQNIINEPDYEIPEPDYTPYQEQEQLVTEDVTYFPMQLIRLGQKIKHATNKRGQTTRKQPRRKKKDKAAH